jgi:hypothetical protein
MLVMQPILNKIQVVANAPAIDADPMNTLNQQALKPILFQCAAAELETLQCFLLADKLSHG